MKTVKIQIKRDEVSKYTKNHLKFKKKLRKVLMQRDENKFIADTIDDYLNGFADFDPLLDWKFRPVCGCEIVNMEESAYDVKHNNLFKNKGFILTRKGNIYRIRCGLTILVDHFAAICKAG